MCSSYDDADTPSVVPLRSAQLAAQLAALPSFTPQASQHTSTSPAATGRPTPNLNRTNSTPNTLNTINNDSSALNGVGPTSPGTARPTFISSGPYRPSLQNQETAPAALPNPVQTDVFGHVVSITANGGQQQHQQQRQRIASMPTTTGYNGGAR